jgi:hypothetical protein
MVDDIPKINPTSQAEPTPSPEPESTASRVQSSQAPSSNPKSPVKPLESKPAKKKKKLKWLRIIIPLVVVWLILSAVIAVPAYQTLQSARATLSLAREAYAVGKNQDLAGFNQKLKATKEQLLTTHKRYQILSWTKVIPLVGRYYRDGNHAFKAAIAGAEAGEILGQTLEPYADVLGFQGQGSFTGGTAEDRIVKVVQTLDKILPQIDQVAEKISLADEELNQIDPQRYPFTIKGRNLKETIETGQTFASQAKVAVTDARPVIELLPQVLGVEEERKYLILFQNDAELRPTGGFMTAYGILRVDQGRVFSEKSDDIYTLDDKFRKRLKAPELIDKYLPLVFYWNLRDMNLSPDFKVSMDTFYHYYQDVPGEPEIDGIISVDTQVLKELIDVLGPIEVPGFGTFTSETDPACDCPQVIYQLELLADRPTASHRSERKGVLAPMMQTILLKAYGSPKQQWPALFSTVTRNIQEKHVLFYMLDEAEQQAAEGVNVAGRLKDFDGDYFHLNDTNFAGAKSNMFTTQEINQEISIDDSGQVSKKVTIVYKNPHPPSNCNLEAGELCLNGILRDVVRLYVPPGSQLKQALGFEEGTVETKEELNKTVFQGFFTLSPQSQAKIVFEYTLPLKLETDEYVTLIQKQPGKKAPQYTLTINQEHQEQFPLNTDKELKIKLK